MERCNTGIERMLDMNNKSRKDKINQEIEKEIKNNADIKKMIDIIAIHLDSDKTQEYFQFIKKIRKYRKKINKKKEKLNSENMIEVAYFEKNGCTNNLFNEVVKEYKGKEPWYICIDENVSTTGNKENWYIINILTPNLILEGIFQGNKYGKYIEMLDFSNIKYNREIYTESIKLIQKHYNKINFLYMKNILEYYDNELEYWRQYLKEKVEIIEKMEELE